MKIAVLTSSIGSTKLLEPKPFDGVDYHAFVDYEDDNISWIKHPIIPFSSDVRYKNRRDAKVYKVLPFAFLPDYDYYFWIDSTHTLQANPQDVIDLLDEGGKKVMPMAEDLLCNVRESIGIT